MNPKTNIDPRGLTPVAYKIINRKQLCQNCGAIHIQSEMLAMVSHPRIRTGFINVPIKCRAEIEYNLPVRVEEAPAYNPAPYCHQCWKPGMLNDRPRPKPVDTGDTAQKLMAMGLLAKEPTETRHFTKAGWQRETWSRETKTPKAPSKPKSKPFTIDDL